MATAMGYIPRIAGGDMSQYDGKMVTLMAQVVSDDGNVAQVKSADGTTISVQRAEGGGNPYSSPYVEIVGKIVSGMFTEIKCTAWNECDMEQYAKMVELQNGQFRGLFHPSK